LSSVLSIFAGYLRDFPSFPTRRSSDLGARSLPAPLRERAVSRSTRLPGCQLQDDCRDRRSCIAGELIRPRTLRAPPAAGAARRLDRKSTRLNSKSHLNLVCRLLLEKKN